MNFSRKNEAYEILKNYSGLNPYLLSLKRDVYTNNNYNLIDDFKAEYIIKNHNFSPLPINKITNIPDWFGEMKKNELHLNFTPKKLKIVTLLGETKVNYHCYVQYRQSVAPSMMFLPKKIILNNFLVSDYNKLSIDFERYDTLSTQKDTNRKLKEHQKVAVKFLISRKKCLLADDQGLGKTTSLSVASIEGNFDAVLIICPASIKTTWREELSWYVDQKYITIIESFNDKTKGELEVFLGYKEGKSNLNREELINEAKESGKWQDNRFVIINYDILEDFYSFPKTNSKVNLQESYNNSPILQFISNKKSLVIIDEAHRLSNRTSNRYKVINSLIKRGNPDSVYLATGTPITNNPENLFCLLQFLDDPIKDDWEYYMSRYCNAMKIPAKGEKAKWTNIYLNKVRKKDWYSLTFQEKEDLKEFIKKNARKITITNGSSNLDELRERISHIYLRRLKSDLPGMVNKTIHEGVYDLTLSQKVEYDRLWDEYEATKKEENPDKEINKELLEGAVYRKYISNIMIPYTERIVDHWLKKGEKVVVACCYDEELYTLKEYYGNRCVIYNGKINAKQKDKAIYDFTNDENIVVFIGNIQAAGVGITLTVSNKLVFNNMSFVPGDNQQMQDRICRIGQKKDCDIYYQYFRNTQYEYIWNTVLKKSLVIDQVIKKESEK